VDDLARRSGGGPVIVKGTSAGKEGRMQSARRLLAFSLLLLASCDSARGMLRRYGEIQRVEREVGTLLAHKDVNAYLLNSPEFMTVEIRNSPLKKLTPAENARRPCRSPSWPTRPTPRERA
jgi:hypothetical protein